jgi:hypothetical protein
MRRLLVKSELDLRGRLVEKEPERFSSGDGMRSCHFGLCQAVFLVTRMTYRSVSAHRHRLLFKVARRTSEPRCICISVGWAYTQTGGPGCLQRTRE